jgi:hypothetical protein
MKIQTRRNKRWVIIFSVALLLLLIGGGCYWYLNHNSKNTQPNNGYYNPSTNNPSVNVPTSNSKEGQSSAGIVSPKDQGNTVAPTPDTSVTPSTPLGTFVSNHHPNLSGSPAPNTETSTCTTTPGVQCQISFTKNDVIKYLPSQLTDINGNTNWSWRLQDIGLTSGAWRISAIATNGSKTSTANDSMSLEVN